MDRNCDTYGDIVAVDDVSDVGFEDSSGVREDVDADDATTDVIDTTYVVSTMHTDPDVQAFAQMIGWQSGMSVSRAEEYALITQAQTSSARVSETARMALCRAYFPFILKEARHTAKRTGLALGDALQECAAEFTSKCIDGFDISTGNRLSTLARWKFMSMGQRADVLSAVGAVYVPDGAIRLVRSGGGDVRDRMAVMSNQAPTRLDAPAVEGGDTTVGERLLTVGPAVGHTESSSTVGAMTPVLQAAIASLSERERDIVYARRLLDEPLTLDALAQRYALSRERVRQIEGIAFKKIQQAVSRSALFATLKEDVGEGLDVSVFESLRAMLNECFLTASNTPLAKAAAE